MVTTSVFGGGLILWPVPGWQVTTAWVNSPIRPTRPTQPSIILGSVITCITGVETIILRMSAWLQGPESVCVGMGCGLVWTPAPVWLTAPLQLQVLGLRRFSSSLYLYTVYWFNNNLLSFAAKYCAVGVVQNIVMYEWLPAFLNQEIPKYRGRFVSFYNGYVHCQHSIQTYLSFFIASFSRDTQRYTIRFGFRILFVQTSLRFLRPSYVLHKRTNCIK